MESTQLNLNYKLNTIQGELTWCRRVCTHRASDPAGIWGCKAMGCGSSVGSLSLAVPGCWDAATTPPQLHIQPAAALGSACRGLGHFSTEDAPNQNQI